MTAISSTAREVLDVYISHWTADPYEISPEALAAAIREIAAKYSYEVHDEGWYELVVDAADLYALADELEKAAR
jgi:hypothetical protein